MILNLRFPAVNVLYFIYLPFKKGLHFVHININSLLPKIEELRNITKSSNISIIGVTETKLDGSVFDSEVNIENYELIRHDRNRQGGGVACYIRKDLHFNKLNIFSDNIENVCFDIVLKNLQTIYSLHNIQTTKPKQVFRRCNK